MKPAQILQQCIDRCARAQDDRSAAQIERRCRERLGGGNVNAMAAAAARRIGEWLQEPRALRAAVPEGSSPQVAAGLAGDDAQRLHAWTSTAHAADLPGHLTASRPSPDASNRHLHIGAWLGKA